jgi:hypothetical protein
MRAAKKTGAPKIFMDNVVRQELINEFFDFKGTCVCVCMYVCVCVYVCVYVCMCMYVWIMWYDRS